MEKLMIILTAMVTISHMSIGWHCHDQNTYKKKWKISASQRHCGNTQNATSVFHSLHRIWMAFEYIENDMDLIEITNWKRCISMEMVILTMFITAILKVSISVDMRNSTEAMKNCSVDRFLLKKNEIQTIVTRKGEQLEEFQLLLAVATTMGRMKKKYGKNHCSVKTFNSHHFNYDVFLRFAEFSLFGIVHCSPKRCRNFSNRPTSTSPKPTKFDSNFPLMLIHTCWSIIPIRAEYNFTCPESNDRITYWN